MEPVAVGVAVAEGQGVPGVGVALAVGADGLAVGADISWTAHATSTLPALLAAVAWGLYSNLSRRWGGPQAGNAMPVFLLASGLVLAVLRACRAERSVWTAGLAGEAVYLVVFPTLLAYVCWDTAARRGNLSLVAALSYLTPLLSVLVSSLYLDLPVPPQLWLAGALVVGACTSGGGGGSTLASTLILGGPPECPQRPFCAVGLEETYGLTFKEFKPLDAGGPITVEAVKNGQVVLNGMYLNELTGLCRLFGNLLNQFHQLFHRFGHLLVPPF